MSDAASDVEKLATVLEGLFFVVASVIIVMLTSVLCHLHLNGISFCLSVL